MSFGGTPRVLVYSVPTKPVTNAVIAGSLALSGGECEYDMTPIPFKIRATTFTMPNGNYPATKIAGPGSCADTLDVVVSRVV